MRHPAQLDDRPEHRGHRGHGAQCGKEPTEEPEEGHDVEDAGGDEERGIDLSAVADRQASEVYYEMESIKPKHLIADPQPMWTTDCYTETVERARRPFEANTTFRATHDGRFNGLAAWFVSDLSDGVELSTAPGRPHTHWGQAFLPIDEAIHITKGTEIRATVHCLPAGPGVSWAEWGVQVGAAERKWHVELNRSPIDLLES